MESKFKNVGANEVLEVGENCYISYNSCPGEGFSLFEADNNSDETAIVIGVKGQRVFKILNGDFREECLEIINNGGGEKELLDLYKRNKNKHSSWSNL